ncbi:MAG TPA: cytochrome-c peroxidase [Acidobacterium sp.]|uniref:Di-heme cytochrome c peroxidase family protein n=2 Tax=Acidobacteriaceae TaxID=204434 RepID=C1F330_ACIC5|nr:di-heme cytochrome c peroxidase family protein [Acidobacterium capsulatum ATCC 51196]HCT61418.1 cytochrome-c peroxidase [Acidobacterium sp.]
MRLTFSALFLTALLSAGTLCLAGSTRLSTQAIRHSEMSAAARLGKKIFFDKSLSGSGKMACATCHDPRFAYGPPNASAVQYGGPDLKTPGYRAAPSLRYVLNYVPHWSDVRASNPIEQLTETENVPTGGYTWDGRYNSLHAQALLPLFSPAEMDNRNAATLAHKLSQSDYAAEFRSVFGARIFSRPAKAVQDAAMALQQFELEDKSFHPYSSKYDRWLDGKASLTPQELHGKELFDNPNSGNCASCHLDEVGANGRHPIFTDFQFEALGVPRNDEIPWNSNPHYYDLGLCGPFRKDKASHDPANCGLFRTPSLRNVAIRKVFFHNGRFHTLRQALLFYVERDTDPGKWYPAGPNGKVEKFNDLPIKNRANVDTTDAPLNRSLGEKPVWNAQQIDDVIAFLKTLTDQDVVKRLPPPPHSANASLHQARRGSAKDSPR